MILLRKKGFLAHLLVFTSILLADDSLAELSFEDLMDIEVSVASKKSESIYDAPGIISSYSRRDIQNTGRYALKDLADITPGFSSTRLYGEPGFETRGVKTSSFNNNHHLVLLDGIPVNHIRANKAPAGEELSLFSAERVEFLRGPASALYGTGAYYGVINIIPAIPELKGPSFRSRIGFAGPVPQRHLDVFSSFRGEKQLFWATASYNQKAPSQSYVGTHPRENFRYWDDHKAISLQGSYKILTGPVQGVGIGAYYLSRESGLGEHWNGDFSHEMNDLHWETLVSFLRFERSLTDLMKLNSYMTYTRSTESGTVTPFSESSFNNYTSGELLAHYEIPVTGYQFYTDLNYSGSILDITGGCDFDWRYQPGPDRGAIYYSISDSGKYIPDENSTRRSPDFRTAASFLQIKGNIPVLEGLELTGGIRSDLGTGGSIRYSHLSPRLGVVQKFTDYLNLKVLYGTALIAPSVKEVKLNEETSHHVPSLKEQMTDLSEETFATFESGLVFHNSLKTEQHLFNVKAEVAAFVNQSLNEITPMQYTGNGKTENYFVNSNDSVIAQGVECEIRGDADFGVGVFGNYTYAEAHNRLTEDLEDVPVHKINGGVTYRSDKIGIYGSMIGRYVSEYTTNSGSNIPGFTTADVVTGWHSPIGIGAEISLSNILDKKYLLPVAGTPLIPMQGRQIQLSLTGEF